MSLQTKQSGELITRDTRTKLEAIEQLRAAASAEIAEATANNSDVVRGIVVARAMQGLRELLSGEVMRDVMLLQNTPLGFQTDKPQGGYPVDVVRDCLIVALLSGFRPTGNEFNIIAGRFYMTKDGARNRVLSWAGLANLEIELGVPQMAGEKGSLVEAFASWRLNGKLHTLLCSKPGATNSRDTRIPVRVNAGMGTDAIFGKATRKLYAKILERLTGMQLDQEDEDIDHIVDVAVSKHVEAEPQDMMEQEAERDPAAAVAWFAEALNKCGTITAVGETLKLLDSEYDWLPAKEQDAIRTLASEVKDIIRSANS